MLTYVLNKDGQPLMPTRRCGKVYRLLKQGKAKCIKRCPFTIQLLYEPETTAVQDITLGVDAGSKHIGLSATTENKVLYEADVELRNVIVNLISTRRESRRARRNRKTRYRAPRFDNRISSKKQGWLAPSVKQKAECHLKVIEDVYKIMPISNVIVEVASFDIQKIKNPSIERNEYQQGEQLNFWNVREYVLFRDNHTCQCCKGKSKDKILNVHHIESRKVGESAPNNLITLCETCHKKFHKGEIKLPSDIKRGMKFNDASFMGIMRWFVYNKLKEIYKNVNLTYGYKTKNMRIENNLPKEHYIDARCISGNPKAESDGVVFYQKKVRCHNRQIHKFNICKGGNRKANQAAYLVKGFRLFDKVLFKKEECFITGRRSSGYFVLKKMDGTSINNSAKHADLKLIETAKHYICERRLAIPLAG